MGTKGRKEMKKKPVANKREVDKKMIKQKKSPKKEGK